MRRQKDYTVDEKAKSATLLKSVFKIEKMFGIDDISENRRRCSTPLPVR